MPTCRIRLFQEMPIHFVCSLKDKRQLVLMKFAVKRYFPYARPVSRPNKKLVPKEESLPVLYAFESHTCLDCQERKTVEFKVGKTINLNQRIRAYKTLNPQGKVLFSIPCVDIHSAERWLHDILKARGCLVKSEVFKVDPTVLINLMKFVAAINDFFHSNSNLSNLNQLLSQMKCETA